MNARDAHFENDYFVKVVKVPHIRGLIMNMPANYFLGKEQASYIYEVDRDMLNIYKNNVKIESIPCPSYALRYMVSTDITIKIVNHLMDTCLIKAYDESGEPLNKSNEPRVELKDLIAPFDDPETILFEDMLERGMKKFSETSNINDIPKAVRDGFDALSIRYVREVNDE